MCHNCCKLLPLIAFVVNQSVAQWQWQYGTTVDSRRLIPGHYILIILLASFISQIKSGIWFLTAIMVWILVRILNCSGETIW